MSLLLYCNPNNWTDSSRRRLCYYQEHVISGQHPDRDVKVTHTRLPHQPTAIVSIDHYVMISVLQPVEYARSPTKELVKLLDLTKLSLLEPRNIPRKAKDLYIGVPSLCVRPVYKYTQSRNN